MIKMRLCRVPLVFLYLVSCSTVSTGYAFQVATDSTETLDPVLQNSRELTEPAIPQPRALDAATDSSAKTESQQSTTPEETMPEVRVQPRLILPEGKPQIVPGMAIQADKFAVPPIGTAPLVRRRELVPEAFSSTHAASIIPGSSESGGPRDCCTQARDTKSRELTSKGDSRDNDESSAPDEESGAFTAVFSTPAHFSTGQCESGLCSRRPPVVIYEGMTVRVSRDGCYELRGVVEGPRLPTIIRLQLTFSAKGRQIATVTPAPITLKPESDSGSHLPNETQHWFIRRTGYSDVLRDWQTQEHHGLSVQRSGVAQTGQVPEA